MCDTPAGRLLPLNTNSPNTPRVEDPAAQPNEQPQRDIAGWFLELFNSGSTLGAFFAGFTLNIVVSDSTKHKPKVRTFAAISSLLFVLTVLLCAGSSLAFTFHKELVGKTAAEPTNAAADTRIKRFYAWLQRKLLGPNGVALLSLTLQLLVLSAVLFFFLVMVAYARVVGWIGVAFTAVALAITLLIWCFQSFVA